ncbi:MAG: hypothetical protein KDC84_09450 [Crocinitomicaceae bacterium]|nr:hypothetical protein [Crocinitomicaceae bacterium]
MNNIFLKIISTLDENSIFSLEYPLLFKFEDSIGIWGNANLSIEEREEEILRIIQPSINTREEYFNFIFISFLKGLVEHYKRNKIEYIECSKESALDREQLKDSSYWLFSVPPDKIDEDVYDSSVRELEEIVFCLELDCLEKWDSNFFVRPRRE